MLVAKKVALLSTAAVLLTSLSRQFHAHAATKSGRVYGTIRHEWEFDQLLSLPPTLLANFCLLTDQKSRNVSGILRELMTSGNIGDQISFVDVEIDEPGLQELTQRYIIPQIPTVVALKGGALINSLEPKALDREELKQELLKWIEDFKTA